LRITSTSLFNKNHLKKDFLIHKNYRSIDSVSLLLENRVNYNCLFFFISKSIDHLYDNDIKQCASQSQDVIESNEDMLFNENTVKEFTKYKSREVQTKLFAIFLPQSPLSEMKAAKIEERTLMNVTRTCQVNTLSYLIKTNESQTLTDHKYDEQGDNVPTIKFEEGELLDDFEDEKIISTLVNEEILSVEEQPKEFTSISSPLKCVNACDTIDLDGPNVSITSSCFDDSTISTQISSDQRDEKYCQPIHKIDLEDIDTQHKKYRKPFNNSNIHIIK